MDQLVAKGDMDPGDIIEDRTFDEIAIGDSANLSHTMSTDDIAIFAMMSGDPAHLDVSYAQASMCGHHITGHGMWARAVVSAVLDTRLPGPGTIYVEHDLQFLKPLGLDDTITVTATAKEKRREKRIVIFDCHCKNQHGEEVVTGTAVTMVPAEKVRRSRVALPELQLRWQNRYRQLISLCAGLEPIPTAVVLLATRRHSRGRSAAQTKHIASPVAPVRRTSSLSPIWKRGTCSPSSSPTWPMPRPPASFLVPGSPSC
jgi:acyl dehydratase